MPTRAPKVTETRRYQSYEPCRHPPRHHDERGTADHVGDHLRHRPQGAEALGLLPDWRGYSRHRGRHAHLHFSHHARQQHLARRPFGFRVYRQHNPVPVRRAARNPFHKELREPRDERATKVAWGYAKRQAQDGVHGRAFAALGVPFRLGYSGNGRGEPRAAKRLASWRCTFRRGNHTHSGASGALLPAVSQARRAGHAQGSRLDEHPQLASEHHSLRRVYRAHPLLKSEGWKGAPSWRCIRRLMARGSTESISPSVRSSPPTERALPSRSTACRTGP